MLASARALTHNEPLWVDAHCTGCELADPHLAHREIGHLDGWGRGLFDGSGALYYTRTRGTTGARTLSWVVRGRGVVSLRIDPHTGALAPTEMPDAISEYFTEDHLPGEEGSAIGTEVAIPVNSSGVSEHDLF